VVADNVTGKVTTMWVNQKVWFTLDTMPAANLRSVECNTTGRFVIDMTSDKGKSIYSSLLTAKTLGLEISVVGNGACNLHGDSEGVSYVRLP
jgi:hypothetical protein